jgi:excisionase family DNA binding protein
MKHRTTQPGVRKNPDSARAHGLRLAVNSASPESVRRTERPHDQAEESSPPRSVEVFDPPFSHTAAKATVGREGETGHLLTVAEVAALLRVPVSWVYGRTRQRSLERLPGYRLGKYWRFREEEILAWVISHPGGHDAA